MALASAKSSALEDNNKAVATGMKWSVEARAEIPQAMRDEIEAEMATKRVLRGGTEEDRMRARAETASLKKKVIPDIKSERVKAGATIRIVVTPTLLRAFNSLFTESRL